MTTHQGEHIVEGWEGQGLCDDVNTKVMMSAELHEEPDKGNSNSSALYDQYYLMTQR